MKYRYITSGLCKPTDSICNFRLVSHREIGSIAKEVGRTIYRVNIPDNLKLEKWACDTYSTTNDKRTIEELGYDIIMTMWDGSRKILPKNIDIRKLEQEQNEKWRTSLRQDYNTAYHPHPKPQEDINFDKQVHAQVLFKMQKENPEAAKVLKRICDEKYGKGWEKKRFSLEAKTRNKENLEIER